MSTFSPLRRSSPTYRTSYTSSNISFPTNFIACRLTNVRLHIKKPPLPVD